MHDSNGYQRDVAADERLNVARVACARVERAGLYRRDTKVNRAHVIQKAIIVAESLQGDYQIGIM